MKLIEDSETFGRDERSVSGTRAKSMFRQLKKGGKANVKAAVFEPPRNTNEISVNRLSLATKNTLAEIGERNANLMKCPRSGHKNKFWGWYTLTASDIRESGCSIKPTPLNDNPYHADIVVPVSPEAEKSKDAFREYAKVLAYRAKFVPWGKWTTEMI